MPHILWHIKRLQCSMSSMLYVVEFFWSSKGLLTIVYWSAVHINHTRGNYIIINELFTLDYSSIESETVILSSPLEVKSTYWISTPIEDHEK